MLEVLYYYAKFGEAWTSHATRVLENVKVFVLCVCIHHVYENRLHAEGDRI